MICATSSSFPFLMYGVHIIEHKVCQTWVQRYRILFEKKWHQWRRSGVFIVNFEHISYIVLVLLLLTLNKEIPAGIESAFCCSSHKTKRLSQIISSSSQLSSGNSMDLLADLKIFHILPFRAAKLFLFSIRWFLMNSLVFLLITWIVQVKGIIFMWRLKNISLTFTKTSFFVFLI